MGSVEVLNMCMKNNLEISPSFLLATHILMLYPKCTETSWKYKMNRTTRGLRLLAIEEKQRLCRVAEFSTVARAELKRR